MTSLSALIDRLAQATEGSRDFNDEVADVALAFSHEVFIGNNKGSRVYQYPGGSVGTALRYTELLEAAMTLAKDADQRRQFLYTAADSCFHSKLDPARHAARLFCLAWLRAIDSGRTE